MKSLESSELSSEKLGERVLLQQKLSEVAHWFADQRTVIAHLLPDEHADVLRSNELSTAIAAALISDDDVAVSTTIAAEKLSTAETRDNADNCGEEGGRRGRRRGGRRRGDRRCGSR